MYRAAGSVTRRTLMLAARLGNRRHRRSYRFVDTLSVTDSIVGRFSARIRIGMKSKLAKITEVPMGSLGRK